MWENRLAKSVNQAARDQFEGGDASPLNALHFAGILRWYSSSATRSMSFLIWSPMTSSSVAALTVCGKRRNGDYVFLNDWNCSIMQCKQGCM